MLQSVCAYGGMVTAPHHLAARAGLRVLQEGGNAVEAMLAAAAVITVVYPHMNAPGGDNFWLIAEPGRAPVGIDACGAAAGMASIDFYRAQGYDAIPSRGPLAALTVAGAVSGWARAHELARGRLPLSRLFEDAIHLARDGVAVTATLADNAASKRDQLVDVPGFLDTYGDCMQGSRLHLPKLVATFEHLARSGLDDFYRGDLARAMAGDLEAIGSPLRLADLERHRALDVEPLALDVAGHTVYNMPPPTQGLASLLLLGTFARLGVTEGESFAHVHGLVESTKAAFRVRDRYVTDPAFMGEPATAFLDSGRLDALADSVDMRKAAPWPDAPVGGDTVWLGAVDRDGRAVSMIQSIYWEFGSGVVLPGSGVSWQNRGTSFSLDTVHHNHLLPYRRPFHTIQPAMASLSDGRRMVYGTMGGEGQSQTQAAVFSRHAMFGQPIQQAVTAPRWLLGRTWGEDTAKLRMEGRFAPELIEAMRKAGHDLLVVGEYEEIMGHAGGIVLHPDGLLEGAADPRSDGAVAAC
ncbi:MAG: gamma-glutamyltransferase family protein [Geminicoccaceae bacterium]|nr:gamma-glutamyltransferase family protein [Geminicoccaceae bacterium]